MDRSRFYESTRRVGGMWHDAIRDSAAPDWLPKNSEIVAKLNRMDAALSVAQDALNNIENDDDQIPAPLWRSVLAARRVVAEALK